MKINVIKKNLPEFEDALLKIGCENGSKIFGASFYGLSEAPVEVTLDFLITNEILDTLKATAESIDDQRASFDIGVLIKIFNNTDTTIIKSLKGMLKALEVYIKKDKIDGWIYKLNYCGEYMPFLVSDITYHIARPDLGRKASVEIYLQSTSLKSESNSKSNNSVEFYMEDLYNKNLVEILSQKHFFKETQEMKDKYLQHIKAYENYSSNVGAQFLSKTKFFVKDHSSSVYINGDRLVNDLSNVEILPSVNQVTSVPFYNSNTKFDAKEVDSFDEFDDFNLNYVRKEVAIPFHPYIKMFNLDKNCNMWLLAGDLAPYVYDKTISEKLVLPEDHRELIDILVCDSDIIMEDIVRNKSGGTSILCKGLPGLGKTLTAEVYAETVGKPLYSVHSGNLGTDPNTIDDKLSIILERAERWNAILLLDEADVYIRIRGDSIQHNSIVAAFLRKIERFKGILFMTTNRVNDIDDAILSRCIAIITYEHFNDTDLRKLWKVLSKQFEVDLDRNFIDKLISTFGKVSGRDIKELLKLVYKYKKLRNSDVNIELFTKCAMFRGLEFKI